MIKYKSSLKKPITPIDAIGNDLEKLGTIQAEKAAKLAKQQENEQYVIQLKDACTSKDDSALPEILTYFQNTSDVSELLNIMNKHFGAVGHEASNDDGFNDFGTPAPTYYRGSSAESDELCQNLLDLCVSNSQFGTPLLTLLAEYFYKAAKKMLNFSIRDFDEKFNVFFKLCTLKDTTNNTPIFLYIIMHMNAEDNKQQVSHCGSEPYTGISSLLRHFPGTEQIESMSIRLKSYADDGINVQELNLAKKLQNENNTMRSHDVHIPLLATASAESGTEEFTKLQASCLLAIDQEYTKTTKKAGHLNFFTKTTTDKEKLNALLKLFASIFRLTDPSANNITATYNSWKQETATLKKTFGGTDNLSHVDLMRLESYSGSSKTGEAEARNLLSTLDVLLTPVDSALAHSSAASAAGL